jgi:hypothetical protein
VPLLVSLVLSFVCSLTAGVAVAVVDPQAVRRGLIVLSVLLVGTGVGVQSSAWNLMPVWYHLVFLVVLVPMCLLGARSRLGSLRPY